MEPQKGDASERESHVSQLTVKRLEKHLPTAWILRPSITRRFHDASRVCRVFVVGFLTSIRPGDAAKETGDQPTDWFG